MAVLFGNAKYIKIKELDLDRSLTKAWILKWLELRFNMDFISQVHLARVYDIICLYKPENVSWKHKRIA